MKKELEIKQDSLLEIMLSCEDIIKGCKEIKNDLQGVQLSEAISLIKKAELEIERSKIQYKRAEGLYKSNQILLEMTK